MSNQKKNPKVNKPVLNTLADYYNHYYGVLLNKLNEEDRAQLLINLGKPNRIIRGEPREYSDVRQFVNAVIEKAEEEYEKAQITNQNNSNNEKPPKTKTRTGK